MAKKRSKNQRQKLMRRVGTEVPLTQQARAFEELKADKAETEEVNKEFDKRYDHAITIANTVDSDPTPEGTLKLLNYCVEFAKWIDSTTIRGAGDKVLQVERLSELIFKNVENRLEQLELTDIEPGTDGWNELREEWLAWRRLWLRLQDQDELPESIDITDEQALSLMANHRESKKLRKAYIVVPPQPDLDTPPPLSSHPKRHSHWEEVVDLQDELIRFWYSPFGRVYGRAFGKSVLEIADPARVRAQQKPGNPPWTPDESRWALELDVYERLTMQLANPIWISSDVQKMILYAAAHPDFTLEHLKAEDVFPNMYGFAVFPESIAIVDQKGRTLRFKAISWMPFDKEGRLPNDFGRRINPKDAGGIFITAYTHRDEPDDYPDMKWLEDHRDELKVPITSFPAMGLCYVTPWSFNTGPPIDMTESGLGQFCAILQTMWRFAKQTIIMPESAPLPRAQRKRAERANLRSDVVVVKLRKRRKSNKANKGEGSKWSVRTIVGLGTGGFWRDQWYPTEQTHHQLWIFPYEAGPDDAPLVFRPLRAYELDR